MKTIYPFPADKNSAKKTRKNISAYLPGLLLTLLLHLFSTGVFAQTTYNFSTAATLSNQGGYYTTQALVTISSVSYKLTHLGNGNFSNLSSGGNSNSACLKKDGAGGDFLKIERADGQPFQFYGMWLNSASMYSPPYYQPPYYNIKYYDQNNSEIVAETYVSNTQNETVTISKNLKVNYVYVTFNAILAFKLDDLIVGPAAASAPNVSTSSINQFTSASALLGGNVTSDGGAAVSESGIVYNTSTNPTVSNNKVIISSGTGSFSQTVTGLSNNTTYYIRSYAINSAGTSYGSELTFTTASAFTMVQTHYFNTSWVSTTSQATPFTKYVEGWNITAKSTGTGLVSVTRITGVIGVSAVGEGLASARAISATGVEDLISLGVKASDNSYFDLQSFKFKYLVKVANTSFGTITVTGYANGVAVPGAVASLNNISQATGASYTYTTFDLSANNNFNNIDQFIITVSNPVSSARLSAIDIDVLNIAAPTTLPLVLGEFTGRLNGKQSILSWITRQEQNTKDFDIQYSTDGQKFISAGNVYAAGNSNSDKAYTFTHKNPANGNNYYRLKMNDIDGHFTYSNVVNLKMSFAEESMSVYPNPATGNYFFINTTTKVQLPLKYRIINEEGKTIQKGSVTQHSQKIKLNNPEKGNYFILLSNGLSQKIVF